MQGKTGTYVDNQTIQFQGEKRPVLQLHTFTSQKEKTRVNNQVIQNNQANAFLHKEASVIMFHTLLVSHGSSKKQSLTIDINRV